MILASLAGITTSTNSEEDPRRRSRCETGGDGTESKQEFLLWRRGARMWMEEHGEKINDARAKQAMDVKADTIAVVALLPDHDERWPEGAQHGREMTSLDIAEIVWKAWVSKKRRTGAGL